MDHAQHGGAGGCQLARESVRLGPALAAGDQRDQHLAVGIGAQHHVAQKSRATDFIERLHRVLGQKGQQRGGDLGQRRLADRAAGHVHDFMRPRGVGSQHQSAGAVASKDILGVAAIAEWTRGRHAGRHRHVDQLIWEPFLRRQRRGHQAPFPFQLRRIGPDGKRAAAAALVGSAGWRHPLRRGRHYLLEIGPRVLALRARMGRHMRHRGPHALAGQSAGHVQAKQGRAGCHIGHARAVGGQPIASHHQADAWLKERGQGQGDALWERYAPVPLPDRGLGRGG